MGCLFVLFIVSFAMQKLLSLIRSYLCIFVFISMILGDRLKKIIAVIYVRECSSYVIFFFFPYVLFKSFIVSSLTFRSLIHFELIFVHGIKNIFISFFHM